MIILKLVKIFKMIREEQKNLIHFLNLFGLIGVKLSEVIQCSRFLVLLLEKSQRIQNF